MKKKKIEINYIDYIVGVLLMIVVGVMPLVVRIVILSVPPELLHMFPQEMFPNGQYMDMFTYSRGWLVLIPAALISFFCVSDWITRGKFPKFKEFFKQTHVILSMVYLAFVIISAVFSSYTHSSWLGTYDRNEGALMWISYFVVFFAAEYFSRDTKYAKFVLYGLAFSSIIMGAIGVSQFIDRNFFSTDLAQWLMTVGGDERVFAMRGSFNPVFTIAHGTQYNPNTFGKYTAMLSPVLLLAALTYEGKRFVNVILLVAGGLMLLGVFGSSSLGGLIGIVTAVAVLLVTYLCKPGIPIKRLAIAAGPVVAALVLAILLITPLNERVMFLFGRLGDAMRAEMSDRQEYVFDENTFAVRRHDADIFRMVVHGMATEGTVNWLTVYDSAGNEILPSSRLGPPALGRLPDNENAPPQQDAPVVYTFDIPNYRTVTLWQFPDIFVYYHRTASPFVLTLENGRLYGVSPTFDPIDLHRDIPAWGFAGRENWGSNRGYIWSRSFPLMPRRTLIGTGPDTFLLVFPQYDIAYLQPLFSMPYTLVDKAHNLFIQTWIQTGGISALALFGLFGHYLFTTFKSLIKSKDEPLFSYGLRLGLLSGVSAFVMSSMATDSTIGSTGVFFVLLGVGYGLNRAAKSKKEQAEAQA